MAQQQLEAPKKVPARNDLKSSPLYKGSRATHLQNRDPNFVYEWKTTDENHPHSLKASGCLEEHERGHAVGGFVSIGGWEVVQRSSNDKVLQAETREDQGKPVDTLIRRGRQVLCRLPREEHAKYQVAEQAYQEAIEKQIYSPERSGDRTASMTAVVSRDENADRMQMLRDSGHPIPGIS